MIAPLSPDNTLLLVVDVQQRLMPAISNGKAVISACKTLLQAANLLDISAVITEQYPEKIGPTVAPLLEVAGQSPVIPKKSFSACCDGVAEILQQHSDRHNILLCGVEAHVCVMQTCLQLRRQDYQVFVVKDAISSRTNANRQIGWERMMAAGALPASVESALFELLQTAQNPHFKAIHKLIK